MQVLCEGVLVIGPLQREPALSALILHLAPHEVPEASHHVGHQEDSHRRVDDGNNQHDPPPTKGVAKHLEVVKTPLETHGVIFHDQIKYYNGNGWNIYIYMYTIVYIYINGSIMIHRPNFSLLRFRDGKVEIGWTMMESRIFDSMGVSIQHPGKGTTMKTIQLKSAWPTVCQLMLQSPASNPRRSDPVSSASPVPCVHICGWSTESTTCLVTG